jgi:hypothetical protein
MHEPDPSASQEISPEQAQALVAAVKELLPNLMPEAYMAEELVRTWLSVNPSADPEIARQAFENHVAFEAHAVHEVDGNLIFLNHHESDFGSQTELRIMRGFETEGEALTFSRWIRVDDTHGPLYTPNIHITDRRGKDVDTTIEEFIKRATSKYPELPEEYEEFQKQIMDPSGRVFNAKILSEAFEILVKLGPNTLKLDYL